MTEDFRYSLQTSPGDASDINYLQGRVPASQQHADSSDTVIMPILQIGVGAENFNRTPIPQSWNLVNIYQNSREGVVKIVGQRDGVDSQGRRTVETVTGSGFFVTEDGKIATDYHVVQGLKGIQIQTADGRTYSAKIEDVTRDVDKAHDLAVIKVTNASPMQRFRALPLGDPNLKPEDGVVAIGYPRGWQDMYASPGIYKRDQPLSRVVSASALGDGEDGNRTVLDSSIHVEPGNSGGPLISKDGRVIGIIATTDAKPDAADDRRSVPGRAAESTPVADLVALLNRSRQFQPTNPVQTAGTLGLDTAPPYYSAPPTLNFGLSAGGDSTPLRRALQGMPGYGIYRPTTDAQAPQSDAQPTLPTFRPQTSNGFFGNLQLNRVRGGNEVSANPTVAPQRMEPAVADSALPASVTDLQREQPPRLLHPVAHGANLFNQVTMLRAGKSGPAASAFSGALGAYDLATEDFGRLRSAWGSGSTSDILWAGTRVGADLMLIGGGIAGFSSKYRAIGSLAAIGGSSIKLISDGNSYYNYFRK